MPVVINEMEIDQAEPPSSRGDAGGGDGGGAAPPSEDEFERSLDEQLARYERLRAH
jgi:hypothetical protein